MNNRSSLDKTSLFFGVLGMLITIAGVIADDVVQKGCFLLGAIFLAVTARLSAHRLFFVLECVVICGSILAFFNLPVTLKATALLACGLAALIYLYQAALLKDTHNQLGALGLIAIATGFATSMVWAYLIGGLILTLYSIIEWTQGHTIAFVWIILNLLFATVAGIALYQ